MRDCRRGPGKKGGKKIKMHIYIVSLVLAQFDLLPGYLLCA